MKFEIFLNFNGNALEAAEFYAKIFKSSVKDIMLFSDAPKDPDYPILDSELDRLMYATVRIADKDVMFMDMSSSYPVSVGNNITPVISVSDHNEIDRLSKELSDGGVINMEPQETFFSEYYAMVTDKFGIIWHISVPEK